jgi:hypothetical protein
LIPSTHHVFPFILLIVFDQKASIKIGENPNLERKKRESSPTSMEVWRKVDAPLPGFPLGANSRGVKGEMALDLGRSSIGEDTTQRAGKRRRRKNMGLEKYRYFFFYRNPNPPNAPK